MFSTQQSKYQPPLNKTSSFQEEDNDVGIHSASDSLDNTTDINQGADATTTVDPPLNGESTENLHVIQSWDELDLREDVMRSIYAYGFDKPSPIQSKGIAPILRGVDVIGQAQSGTGKTATFVIGTLGRIDPSVQTTQAIILAPTRELALQIEKVITGLSTMIVGLHTKLMIGGNSVESDAASLKKSVPHIVVGSPGRVHDMMRRNYISTKHVKLVVIDEADEMLSSEFKEQLYKIFQFFNNDIQVALFSATLPDDIYAITTKFMRNPVRIFVKKEQLTLEGISQYFVAVEDDRQKYLTLQNLFAYISMTQCIIYCNSVKRVADLYDAMIEDNFPVCCIHSNMESAERTAAYNDFLSGKYRVLISSNVTARGIDVQQVSVVINFDIPRNVHSYLHRIGRSGRWGRKGSGINFITRRDVQTLKEIEEHYACEIRELPADLNNIMKS